MRTINKSRKGATDRERIDGQMTGKTPQIALIHDTVNAPEYRLLSGFYFFGLPQNLFANRFPSGLRRVNTRDTLYRGSTFGNFWISMTESSQSPPLFEESLLQLEKIVRQLEDGKTSLEDALKKYEEGVQLLRHCHVFLNQAQRQIEILQGVSEDGTPILEPVSEESVRTTLSAVRK
ncbi:MAG: exodeoxyribonuclease VII small subunit [Thermoguttaceae bacterium]